MDLAQNLELFRVTNKRVKIFSVCQTGFFFFFFLHFSMGRSLNSSRTWLVLLASRSVALPIVFQC